MTESDTAIEPVELHINGQRHQLDVPNDETLLVTLRERLRLRSVRESCGIGICGTCTVQLDGRAVSSCLALTCLTGSRQVTTSEGLAPAPDELTDVQRSFVSSGAFQCSYCIPGMVVTLEALFARNPQPQMHEVLAELEGHLCRCGTYPRVLAAVRDLITERAAAPINPQHDTTGSPNS
jgi:aerobic-type carbon monoxide dehydrogenase small subunit (CoxS/CutS family)